MNKITKTYHELSPSELADARRLFPGVSADDPYLYAIVAGKLHHRVSADAPIAVRIEDDRGPHYLRRDQVVALSPRSKGGQKGVDVHLRSGDGQPPHTLWIHADPDYLAKQIGW
ncbi:hypothetical protein WS58_16485 [Burkholderia pseudomultivorans]|uniref:hypothetical protein n=1 Tax=Burkholderia pseudomultivorans TaxID=1207504 RepID=UPI0007530417|nr:hypothetical protein [Burkholderia pseudomultivorans]AOI94080.1 hypothetical protein WS57_34710 [Burkholderia pseudomultivorans]KVC27764.1 hypothetical protein WS55_12855 [Burkholderia pseudomultivorans]KVC36886.1 hypothetical protein WS56_00225 [Burkholderia pseudomultivorans]KVC42127.1 hypothetical protein WS58_16485 [Burkholderia pseudomultivorans]